MDNVQKNLIKKKMNKNKLILFFIFIIILNNISDKNNILNNIIKIKFDLILYIIYFYK